MPAALRRLVQGAQRLAGIGRDRQRTLLVRIVAANVDADETHLRIVEARLRAGGEVGQARADRRSPGRPG